MKLRKKLNCATSEACYLTIRSSRWRFTATFFYGKFLFYCGRAAPRLNSGVRLSGKIHVGFKTGHAASKAHPFLQGKSAAQSHLRQVKRTRRCGSKRLSVGQKHWFVAADRANVWVRVAPNCFANHAVVAHAPALGTTATANGYSLEAISK